MKNRISKLPGKSVQRHETLNGAAGGRFMLIGGFLGAGKTTCLGTLTRLLAARGLRAGLITNDQGNGLVDTAMSLQTSGGEAALVREIIGGCFCCRANDLVAALRDMEAGQQKPEVFIAEPVGSCTDLVATVLLPLEKAYGKAFQRAPMSVVVDAKRAWAQYFGTGRAAGKEFSKDVRYIYLKQLEEAEILVINKVDLLKPALLQQLMSRLERDWPGKRILCISARDGQGCNAWLDLLMGEESKPKALMEMDYDRYAVGEALMGWFNATLRVKSKMGRDGNRLLLGLARKIQTELEERGAVLAHFKMSLECGAGLQPASREPLEIAGDPRELGRSKAYGLQARATLAVVNAVRNGAGAELSQRLEDPFHEGKLLINLRAEAAPELLEEVVMRHVNALPSSLLVAFVERAAFRPGKPEPTYRVTELGAGA